MSERSDALVVCAGQRMDPVCAEAMERYRMGIARGSTRFVFEEWLEEDQFAKASFVWVVDALLKREYVLPAVRRGLAILVPRASAELTEFCRVAGCGMPYGDAEEAVELLKLLATRKR